jgi:hypothetical protein
MDEPLSGLPKSELVKKLQKFNGTPVKGLQSDELLDLTLPTIRADLELYETYEYHPEPPIEGEGDRTGSLTGPDHSCSLDPFDCREPGWRPVVVVSRLNPVRFDGGDIPSIAGVERRSQLFLTDGVRARIGTIVTEAQHIQSSILLDD